MSATHFQCALSADEYLELADALRHVRIKLADSIPLIRVIEELGWLQAY